MQKMRRSDREITDVEQLLDVIERCQVVRLALQDKDGLYIVPLNFGYSYENDKLTLFIHSATEGRKISAWRENSQTAFEMDCDHEVRAGNAPCSHTFAFSSVIGAGNMRFVNDPEEKNAALNAITRHMVKKEFAFTQPMMDVVEVLALSVDWFTGKRRP